MKRMLWLVPVRHACLAGLAAAFGPLTWQFLLTVAVSEFAWQLAARWIRNLRGARAVGVARARAESDALAALQDAADGAEPSVVLAMANNAVERLSHAATDIGDREPTPAEAEVAARLYAALDVLMGRARTVADDARITFSADATFKP